VTDLGGFIMSNGGSISSTTRLAAMVAMVVVLASATAVVGAAGCAGSAPAKISTGELEPLVREHQSAESSQSGFTSLEIEELVIPELWSQMQMQLFSADFGRPGAYDGRQYFIYRDGQLTRFPWVRVSARLTSATAVDGGLYYTFTWGSGVFYQGLGRLSVDDERISSVESPPLERGNPARAAIFVKEAGGRVQLELGSLTGMVLNSWEPRDDIGPVGLVEVRDSSLFIVDASGADVDWQELNSLLAESRE
jgi:hypothetical protein